MKLKFNHVSKRGPIFDLAYEIVPQFDKIALLMIPNYESFDALNL